MKLTNEQTRSRYSEIFLRLHDGWEKLAIARKYGKSVPAIDNWMVGTSAPASVERDRLLTEWGVKTEFYTLSDVEWEVWLVADAPTAVPVRSDVRLLSGNELDAIEISLKAETPVICVVTEDAFNEVNYAEVATSVRQNLSDGISYLYVTTDKCADLDRLKRKIESFRDFISANTFSSSVHLAVVPVTYEESLMWKTIDHVLIFFSEDIFENGDLNDISTDVSSKMFRQVYKHSDPEVESTAWLECSERQKSIFLDLLAAWYDKAAHL